MPYTWMSGEKTKMSIKSVSKTQLKVTSWFRYCIQKSSSNLTLVFRMKNEPRVYINIIFSWQKRHQVNFIFIFKELRVSVQGWYSCTCGVIFFHLGESFMEGKTGARRGWGRDPKILKHLEISKVATTKSFIFKSRM